MEAVSGNWNEGRFADYKAQLSLKQNSLNVWELIELVGMGYFTKGMDRQTTSMGISEVFQELILDILKQVRNGLKVCESTPFSPLRLEYTSYNHPNIIL